MSSNSVTLKAIISESGKDLIIESAAYSEIIGEKVDVVKTKDFITGFISKINADKDLADEDKIDLVNYIITKEDAIQTILAAPTLEEKILRYKNWIIYLSSTFNF